MVEELVSVADLGEGPGGPGPPPFIFSEKAHFL